MAKARSILALLQLLCTVVYLERRFRGMAFALLMATLLRYIIFNNDKRYPN